MPPSTPPVYPALFTTPSESWSIAARAYDTTVAPNSRAVSPSLVAMADALRPLSFADTNILEFGCGTGALTHTLRRLYPSAPLLATDIAPGMLGTMESLAGEPAVRISSPLSSEGIEIKEDSGTGLRTQLADMADPYPGLGGEQAARNKKFTHIFCSQALQTVGYPSDTIMRWVDMLVPGGVLAVVSWDYDQECGPMETWRRAARVVLGEDYRDPKLLPEGAWEGRKEHVDGIAALGVLEHIKVEGSNVGFRIGGESREGTAKGFLDFWWKADNPVARERLEGRSEEEKKRLYAEMERVLKEDYADGTTMPQSSVLVVGRKK